MKIMKFCIAFVSVALLFDVAICEAKTTYSIEYAPHSPIKNVPLKNASLRLEFYAYGKPHGFTVVKTNGNQKFTFENKHYLEVVEIMGEHQYHAFCSGNATENQTIIKITCNPR